MRVQKKIEQMKNLEEKFKGLMWSKNRGKSQVDPVEKEHVKQMDSNSKSSTTNVEEVMETHFVETSNVYVFKEANHKLGFFRILKF